MDEEGVLVVAHRILTGILSVLSIGNLLTGAAVVGLGIFILLDLSPQYGYNYIMYFAHLYGFNQKPGIFKAALLMVVGGLIVIVYGIVSLVTFCRRSYKYMFTHIILLMVCIAIEVSIGVYVVRFQQEIDKSLGKFLVWTIKEEYEMNENTTHYYLSAWNHVQKEYMCCGANNGSDWALAERWDRDTKVLLSNGSYEQLNLTVPVSCCRMLSKSQLHTKWFGLLLTPEEKLEMRDSDTELYDQPCLHKPTAYNSYIETGCEKSLAKHMLHYNAIILSGAVVLTVAQALGIPLTIIFFKSGKKPTNQAGNPCAGIISENEKMSFQSSRSKFREREVKKKYTYFDDDFDDRWESPL